MSYSRNAIVDKCNAALHDPKSFYQDSILNLDSITTDTQELCGEVIAEFLCEHISEYISGIPQISRQNTYRMRSHTGAHDKNSPRKEEVCAMQMFLQSKEHPFDHIGVILDYQTPLKNTRKDSAGKIDLLAYDGKTLRILELKRPDNDESMLRCVLEGYTYLKTANHKKLLADFGLPADTELVSCPFVFRDGIQHKEMQEHRPQLKRLMQLLYSKPYYITEENEKYYVTEE